MRAAICVNTVCLRGTMTGFRQHLQMRGVTVVTEAQLSYGHVVVLLAANYVFVLQSYTNTINGPPTKQVLEDIHNEFQAQIADGTRDIELGDLPRDSKTVNRKRVFRMKPECDGAVARFKAIDD